MHTTTKKKKKACTKLTQGNAGFHGCDVRDEGATEGVATYMFPNPSQDPKHLSFCLSQPEVSDSLAFLPSSHVTVQTKEVRWTQNIDRITVGRSGNGSMQMLLCINLVYLFI